jgi:hypothetical protein
VFQPRPTSYAQAVANSARTPLLSSPRLPSELARSELGADSFEVSHLLLLHYVVLFYCFLWYKILCQFKLSDLIQFYSFDLRPLFEGVEFHFTL